jgi:hypothetical protein
MITVSTCSVVGMERNANPLTSGNSKTIPLASSKLKTIQEPARNADNHTAICEPIV